MVYEEYYYYDNENWTYNWSYEEENPYRKHNLVFDVILLILTLVGNFAVLLIIINVAQRSRTNFYIKNLAAADLLCGIFYIVPRIVRHINDGRFYGGNILCKLQEYLANVGTFGSITIMVALSLDRLNLLLRPVGSHSLRGKNPIVPCLLCWVTAGVVSVTGPIVFEFVDELSDCIPYLDEIEYKIYFTTIFVVVFIIPTIILAVCYSIIAIIIWKMPRRNESTELTEMPSSPLRQSPSPTSRRNSENSGSDQREPTLSKSQIRTIEMTFVIVLAFICCWAPYMMVNLLTIYSEIYISSPVNIFINSLLPLNSVVNPIIFAVFSTRLLKQCRRKISRCLCRRRM